MWCIFNTITDKTLKYFSSHELAELYWNNLSVEDKKIFAITLMD